VKEEKDGHHVAACVFGLLYFPHSALVDPVPSPSPSNALQSPRTHEHELPSLVRPATHGRQAPCCPSATLPQTKPSPSPLRHYLRRHPPASRRRKRLWTFAERIYTVWETCWRVPGRYHYLLRSPSLALVRRTFTQASRKSIPTKW